MPWWRMPLVGDAAAPGSLPASPRVYIPSFNRALPAAGSGVRTRGFRRPRARAGGEDEPGAGKAEHTSLSTCRRGCPACWPTGVASCRCSTTSSPTPGGTRRSRLPSGSPPQSDSRHVAVSVSDEGRGVAPELLPHLFRKGAGAGEQGTAAGHGLGLAICKGSSRRMAAASGRRAAGPAAARRSPHASGRRGARQGGGRRCRRPWNGASRSASWSWTHFLSTIVLLFPRPSRSFHGRPALSTAGPGRFTEHRGNSAAARVREFEPRCSGPGGRAASRYQRRQGSSRADSSSSRGTGFCVSAGDVRRLGCVVFERGGLEQHGDGDLDVVEGAVERPPSAVVAAAAAAALARDETAARARLDRQATRDTRACGRCRRGCGASARGW